MKLFFALFLASFSALASTGLEQEVANQIDAILSDTVNEGDINASVKVVRGKPAMSCTTSPMRTPGKGLVKCSVDIEIEDYVSDDTVRCENSCFLGYVYDLRRTKKIDRAAGDLERNCIEVLSSGCQ